MTYAEQLAEFIVDVDPSDAVLADAHLRLIDTLGNAVAALEDDDPEAPFRIVRRHVLRRGGAGTSTLLGTAERVPATSAAFDLGTLAHSLDFDDTHLPSVLHPSASVIPAALAAAEEVGASGTELLRAIARGIEVTNRLGMASYDPVIRNSIFFEKGLHATSICGTIGAAVAVASILGANRTQTMSAMGIAASMGAGLIEANRTGGTVKRIHCGWAAQSGVEAAMLAIAGITGPPTIFEGRFGFLRAYLDDVPDAEALVRGLGHEWESLRTVFKPYPSNHFTHPGIDCALELRRQGLEPEKVVALRLGVAGAPLRTIGAPREEKIAPRSPYHAKFSGPYTVATALVGGGGLGVYLDDFSASAFTDPLRLRLAAATQVEADDICDDEFPRSFSATLEATTDDGKVWSHRVHSSRGGPQHPLSRSEVLQKFSLNARRSLDEAASGRLRDTLDAVAELASLREALPVLQVDVAQ